MKKILFLIIYVLFFFHSYSQNINISGTVTDKQTKVTLPGVVVSVIGTSQGTLTDENGNFRIKVRKQSDRLKFSLIGYKDAVVEIRNKNILNVELDNSDVSLNEVVVTAGGLIRQKREQGYAATKITADELNSGKSPSLAGGLTAKVPGLQINAISSGVNPNYHLILRGNRSITGNNEALIVVDNSIVPNEFLGNLNPEDIEDIQVLNGAAGATLYGSEASNGVLIVTTKKGSKGRPVIKVSNTLTFENVSFYPKLQSRFGQGSTADGQVFSPIENQQYGPVFDGSVRNLGYPLENGDQQTTTYSAKSDRKNFWDTGVQNQTDFSISFGTDKSSSYLSAQYLDVKGTTPHDKYNRISLRANNEQKILPNLDLTYNASYTENNYDITSETADVYDYLLNISISANVPLLQYKDWENNKWATLDGWYNPWYLNPYWEIDNNRNRTKNSYLNGKIELKWDLAPWLWALYRGAISNRYYQTKNYDAKATFSDYSIDVEGKSNETGSIYDETYNTYRFNQDFELGLKEQSDDFSFNFTAGLSWINKSSKDISTSATGLVIDGLYNIGNRSGDSSPAETITHSKSYGLWGDILAGYKNFLFLHVTGRNDWTSLLAKENRSFFYCYGCCSGFER